MNHHEKEILVIDDSRADLGIISQLLQKNGYRVRLADTVALALRSLKAQAPDLILLDINLRGESGFDVCKQIKANSSLTNTPIIFITASDRIEEKVRSYREGAVDYITKPFNDLEVLAKISTHIDLAISRKDLEERHRLLQQDILKISNTENELRTNEVFLKKMIQISSDFLQSGLAKVDFSAIADMMMEISCAKYVVFNLFDENGSGFTTSAISGLDQKLVNVASILGFNLLGKHWDPDPKREKLIKDNIITYLENIQSLDSKFLSGVVLGRIAALFGLGLIAIVKISSSHKEIGDFTLLFPKDGQLKNESTVQLFANEVGLIVEGIRTNAALKEAKEDWEFTFESMVDVVTIHDENFTIIRANKTARKVLGLPEDYQNRECKCYQYIHGTESRPQSCVALDCMQMKKDAIIEESYIPHLNKYFELRLVPRFDANSKFAGMIHIMHDITARKKSEEEKKNLQEKINLDQRIKALGVLSSGIAHNFNNLLTSIMATASLRMEDSLSKDDIDSYKLIDQLCHRGKVIIRSLSMFAKPTLSSMMPLNIKAVINEVLMILENSTRNKVNIIRDLCEEEVWVSGDVGNLNSVFMNLFLNSVDAMSEEGTLTVRVRALDEAHAEIQVTDTGSGMEKDVLDHIFEPFFTTKEPGKGVGLGLPMSYGIIEAHGGTMHVTSGVGIGTTFIIALPKIPKPLDTARQAPGVDKSKLPKSVFLVDDDNDVRFLMGKILEKLGMKVRSFESGESCLAALEKEPLPEIVVLDENMPRMSGRITLQRIRAMNLNIPVLISSGQIDIEDLECFKIPNVAVIPKPFNAKEIEIALSKLASVS